MDNVNEMILMNEEGQEQTYEIFFTYTDEETDKKYVFYYNAEIDEDEDPVYFVSRYEEEGNQLYDLDVTEQEMAEEVFNTFVDENEYEIES